MQRKILFVLTVILCGWFSDLSACTIFSAKDKKGHVWAGNNEDMYFTFNTYLNIVSKTDSSYGYIYFSYYSPSEYPQGGVNEAGLFYDGNALNPSKTKYKGYNKKMDFPGGPTAIIHHIMRKCKTVQEVFSIVEKYRVQGLEGAQIHVADKYGNLGIIVADSMWITKSGYQISTNYNLCHPDKDGVKCWRFPIAERILKSNEPCFDTFREICDSTSQKSIVSTIYSNIQDLNTGDIWFYYGMDYDNAYKTTISDLLKKGNTSILFRELFSKNPLVEVYNTYKSKGVNESLKKLNKYELSLDKKNEILRLLSTDLILFNHEFRSYPFISDLIKSKKETDEFLQVTYAIALFNDGKKEEAIDILKKYLNEKPKSTLANDYLNHMQGVFKDGANIKFELTGFNNAKYVFVDGFTYPNFKYFLIQKEGKWIGEFKLPPNEYSYYFSIDGERVMDPNNPDIIKKQGIDYNRIIIKK